MTRYLLALLLLGCASSPQKFQRLYLPGESADHFWVIVDGEGLARCWQSPSGPICQSARMASPDPPPDHLRERAPVAKPTPVYPVLPDQRPAD